MKKNLFALLLCLMPMAGFADIATESAGDDQKTYNVSTEVQKKNVLLEEFTGVRCGNCPKGHKAAEKLKMALGDRLSVISVHQGHLAFFNGYNYMTDAGDALGDLFGVSSWPSGMVNRSNRYGDYLMGFYSWSNAVKQTLNEDAPVNLWSEATYDMSSRELKVRVEGYFTGAVTDPAYKLCVMLLQDDVVGYQNNLNTNDYNYTHKHMLRDAINGTFGELITDCASGKYFVKEYTYSVPTAIGDVNVKPEDLELVVFVTKEDNRSVQNTLSVKPTYTGDTMPLKAKISSDMHGVTDGYQFNFLPLTLNNKSNSVITSADFDITLNGSTVTRHWTGNIRAFGSHKILLPIDWSAAYETGNMYTVTLTRLNDTDVEGSAMTGYFNCMVYDTDATVTVKIRTSSNYEDFTYRILDMDGSVVKEFGPYNSEGNFEETVTLDGNTKYCLEQFDRLGNGYRNPNEYVLQLCNSDGTAVAGTYGEKSFATRLLFKTGAGTVSDKLNLNVTSGTGGEVSLKGTTLRETSRTFRCVNDENVTLTITPDDGYTIRYVKVNGNDMTADAADGTLNVKVSATTDVDVTFMEKNAKPMLSISVEGAGTIMCNGSVITQHEDITPAYGEEVKISVMPDEGHILQSLTFNDSDVTSQVNPASGEYITPAITDRCTLNAVFAVSSDIDSIEESGISVNARNGQLTIEGVDAAMTVSIYTAGGALLRQFTPTSSVLTISLAAGSTYIVSIDGNTFKVAM